MGMGGAGWTWSLRCDDVDMGLSPTRGIMAITSIMTGDVGLVVTVYDREPRGQGTTRNNQHEVKI